MAKSISVFAISRGASTLKCRRTMSQAQLLSRLELIHYLVTVLFQKKEYQILQKPYIILDTVYQLLR